MATNMSLRDAWLPPLLWMALIVWFSSEAWGADRTSRVVVPVIQLLLPWLTPAQVQLLHWMLRKGAHLTEYAVLSLLWFRAFVCRHRWGWPRAALTALAISVAWAATDEAHQAFVPNRGASSVDVLLDAIGAVLALAVICLSRGRPWAAERS
jgi:VanZ family protein